MGNILGSFFDKQVVPSRAWGAFGASTLGDGIVTGCELSYSGTVLSIGRGHIIAGGRMMEIASEISVSLSGATSGYARVVIQIDLTKTATKTTFEQVDVLTEYSATLAGFGTLTQQNINLDGTLYQMPFCVCALDSSGITGIPESAALLRPRTGFAKLWTNPTPSASFPAQKLSLPGLGDYDTILIGHMTVNKDGPRYRWEIFHIPEYLRGTGEIRADLYSHYVTSSWGDCQYKRAVLINLDEEYLRFTVGWKGGATTGTDNAVTVPIEVYGLNMDEPLGVASATTTTLPAGGAPGQYLGIDTNGNIVWMDAPEGSGSDDNTADAEGVLF